MAKNMIFTCVLEFGIPHDDEKHVDVISDGRRYTMRADVTPAEVMKAIKPFIREIVEQAKKHTPKPVSSIEVPGAALMVNPPKIILPGE